MDFADKNFRLMVINFLLMEGQLQEGLDDVLVRHWKDDYYGNKPLPDILEFFNGLKLPRELLNSVHTISPDTGDDIYLHLVPNWDAMDSQFNISNLDDVRLLPNLKKIIIYCLANENSLDLGPLLELPRLEEIDILKCFIKESEENDIVMEKLKNRKLMTAFR
ncbi:MAG: hypothetical protein JW969_11110 [Spirochaetales bacterium]|nr:hypothetical protein [Spirochaetales bacterium]